MTGKTYSPFFGYWGVTTTYCTFMYDGTGFEEFYDFTTYPVTLYTFWGTASIILSYSLVPPPPPLKKVINLYFSGLNSYEGLSAANQSAIVQQDLYVKPNITIVNDDHKDFYHMQTGGNPTENKKLGEGGGRKICYGLSHSLINSLQTLCKQLICTSSEVRAFTT